MTNPSENPPPVGSLERFFKLGVGALAWVLLISIFLFIGSKLQGIVVLFGFCMLFTYLLLGPVNIVGTIIDKPIRAGLRYVKLAHIEGVLPRNLSRVLAIFSMYLTFILLALFVAVRLLPVTIDQLGAFSKELPVYSKKAEDWVLSQSITQNYFHKEVAVLRSKGQLSHVQEEMLEKETIQSKQYTMQPAPLSPVEREVIREKVFSTSDRIETFLKDHIGSAFGNLWTVITTTLTGFVYLLTGMVLVFYFLLDGERLKEGFLDLLPYEMHDTANYLLSSMHGVMYGFVKSQVFLGIVTGAYMLLIYSIFGVPYAIFLSAFFAVAEILPVVGTWLGFTPGILVLLFTNPVKLLFVMGFVYVYQLIKDNIVAPKMVGEAMGLHPVIVILSLLICSKVAGLVGILFAIPVASMVNVILRYLLEKHYSRITYVED